MIITVRGTTPAPDMQVVTEVTKVLERRAAMKHPPVTLTVSDAVALGIAGILRSETPSGRVLGNFYTRGAADSAELVEAAQVEQGYASPEGHAALYCLIGWVNGQLHRESGKAGPAAARRRHD